MKNIFADLHIRWESISEVEETVPDTWAKKYRARMEDEDREDTMTSSEMLAKESTS